MAGATDRRPWLIISRREATALLQALRDQYPPAHSDLDRAMRELRMQIEWLDNGRGLEPNKEEAIRRHWGFSA